MISVGSVFLCVASPCFSLFGLFYFGVFRFFGFFFGFLGQNCVSSVQVSRTLS